MDGIGQDIKPDIKLAPLSRAIQVSDNWKDLILSHDTQGAGSVFGGSTTATYTIDFHHPVIVKKLKIIRSILNIFVLNTVSGLYEPSINVIGKGIFTFVLPVNIDNNPEFFTGDGLMLNNSVVIPQGITDLDVVLNMYPTGTGIFMNEAITVHVASAFANKGWEFSQTLICKYL